MPQTAKYDIFLDGSCSFCRWSQAKIEPYDSGERVRFLDYNDPAVAESYGSIFACDHRQNEQERSEEHLRATGTAFPARPRAATPIRVLLLCPVHSEAIVRIA